MKSKLLPIGLFTLILGIATIILASGLTELQTPLENGNKAIQDYPEYLTKIRSNQITQKVNPVHELQAKEAQQHSALKSGNSLELGWTGMGPDNTPGIVRAMLFDNQAGSQSLVLAGATGGLWRTNNLGASWSKLADSTLKVTSMVQDSDGTIYAATGNGFCNDNLTFSTSNIYYGGIVGDGIYRSTADGSFELLSETKPTVTGENDTVKFAYIYEMAYDQANNRIYSATNTGLWFSDNKGDNWTKVSKFKTDSISFGYNISIDTTILCDSYTIDGDELIIEGIDETIIDTVFFEKYEDSRLESTANFGLETCNSVSVGAGGNIMATFNNRVYVSDGGADPVFINVSSNPVNDDITARDIKNYSTNLTVIDTLENSYNRGLLTFTDTSQYAALAIPASPFSNATQGRTKVAVAPSDENVYYAVCTNSSGNLQNIYLSTDKGANWEIIFPGGSSGTTPFAGSSCFNMALTVFPNDPFKVLVGGEDLWYGQRIEPGKFFDWGAGAYSQSFAPGLPTYLPARHHNYVFFPNSNNKIAVATNRGVSFATFASTGFSTEQVVRGLSNAQVYSLGISSIRKEFISGIQSHGVTYVSGDGNTPQTGETVFGPSGSTSLISTINPSAFLLSNTAGIIERSADKGFSTSLNFTMPTGQFITPMALWENFDDQQASTTVKFFAGDSTYVQGDKLLVRSANKGFEGDLGYPFEVLLDVDTLKAGDSIAVKDIIQSKLFFATSNEVFMTREMIKFDSIVTHDAQLASRRNLWKILQTSGGKTPSALAISACGNYLFVGTENGYIYRIANIQNAYDKASGDMDSPFFVISTDEMLLEEGRFITSISIDQNDPAHILVTLGNYGNEAYIYQSKNALDLVAGVEFTDITANLPAMPVYSSLIEMNDSNIGIIGTELGLYSTTGLLSDAPDWSFEPNVVGKSMVVKIEQQTVYKEEFIIQNNDPLIPDLVYPGANNYGDIYIATFGRGVFRNETFHQPVGVKEHTVPGSTKVTTPLTVFPNPVNNQGTIRFELPDYQEATITIYDVTGKIVNQYQTDQLPSGNNEFTFERGSLKSGIYFIGLQSGSIMRNGKFIVK
jgi:hypothetical protein